MRRGADTRVGLSCGRQSCLQAAFQAACSIRDEFLGLFHFHARGHETAEISFCMSNCARLDKLKHVPRRRRRDESRRCRHECPRHVRSNGSNPACMPDFLPHGVRPT
jgi:hypothetical protein